MCDSMAARIQVFSREGIHQRTINPQGLSSPAHIAVTPHQLFVRFTLPNCIYKLDKKKVTRDRVFVLDGSDTCMFIFNSEHLLINRIITRGSGKQTNNPFSFDIDRDYNIVMSDYSNHCVYVFSKEGELIHTFGKQGQGIGEFYSPYGIVLDSTGRIIVVCWKDANCLQFF